MPGASQSQLSEFFGSGRQSKATVFVDGRLGHVDLSSYVSGDFLSAASPPPRLKPIVTRFASARRGRRPSFSNGWSFLGGQAWSLVTEDAKGIAPDDDMGKTNDVRPNTIDPSYNVGFDFARQYGIRLTKSFGDKVAVAFAIENPQATLTTQGTRAISCSARLAPATATTPRRITPSILRPISSPRSLLIRGLGTMRYSVWPTDSPIVSSLAWNLLPAERCVPPPVPLPRPGLTTLLRKGVASAPAHAGNLLSTSRLA